MPLTGPKHQLQFLLTNRDTGDLNFWHSGLLAIDPQFFAVGSLPVEPVFSKYNSFSGVGSLLQLTGPLTVQHQQTAPSFFGLRVLTQTAFLHLGDTPQICGVGFRSSFPGPVVFSQQQLTLQRFSPFCRVGSCLDFTGLVENPLIPFHLHFTLYFIYRLQQYIDFSSPPQYIVPLYRQCNPGHHPPNCRVGSCQFFTGLVADVYVLALSRVPIVYQPVLCTLTETAQGDCATRESTTVFQQRSVTCPPNCRVGSWFFLTGLVVQVTAGVGVLSDRPYLDLTDSIWDFCTPATDNQTIAFRGTTPGDCSSWLCFLLSSNNKQNWGWAPLNLLACNFLGFCIALVQNRFLQLLVCHCDFFICGIGGNSILDSNTDESFLLPRH